MIVIEPPVWEGYTLPNEKQKKPYEIVKNHDKDEDKESRHAKIRTEKPLKCFKVYWLV